MNSFENNAFFWQKLDTLFLSSQLVITKEKGDSHPQYQNLIYPVKYGYLTGTNGGNDKEVCVYRGSLNSDKVNCAVVAVDILKRDLDIKLLSGCSEEEEDAILRFLNQTDFQKTVAIRRGTELPSWAITD